MNSIDAIAEIANARAGGGLVRIPPDMDVPLTPRVRRLIDTPAFRRLAEIGQLGLVSLVYPAANHTRQEHSLGVYRVALDYLARLSREPRFAAAVEPAQAELFLVAALLHDIGHWPYCHPIEDMQLDQVPRHEDFAARFLAEGEIAQALRDDWGIEPAAVTRLLAGEVADKPLKVLHSMLSGPIDVDKVDYLMRDSLHAGVPYGRNFDQHRLVRSLCLNAAGDGLAITEKGKTAAEMMVFARYVMFSEVYWHHAVRSATAMLQRAFYLLVDQLPLDEVFCTTQQEMIEALVRAAGKRPAGHLLAGLFGPTRQLYKRLAQYSYIEDAEIYARLARRPFPWLVTCSAALAEVMSTALGEPVEAEEVLFDAPPTKLEVEFNIDVYATNEQVYRRLGDVSPVVRTLAQHQFDNYVKRVRIFVHPRLADAASRLADVGRLVDEAIDRADQA